MDKLNLISKDKKKNYFYYVENNHNNFVITNKIINNFDLNDYTLSLNSNNITRYIKDDIVIERISNVDLSKLGKIDITNLDICFCSNYAIS